MEGEKHTTKHRIWWVQAAEDRPNFLVNICTCKCVRFLPRENLPWVGPLQRTRPIVQTLGTKPHARSWYKSLHFLLYEKYNLSFAKFCDFFCTTSWWLLKPCEMRMFCPKCSLPKEGKTKTGYREVINRKICKASNEAALKSPTLGGHCSSRHWDYLNKYYYHVSDTILLRSSSQGLHEEEGLSIIPILHMDEGAWGLKRLAQSRTFD